MATIRLDGHDIEVTKADKELFPADNVTKGDLVEYYRSVAEVMLPHLAGRPLTMRRFPDGIDSDGFFQKHPSAHFPDWMTVVEVPQRTRGETVTHVVCDSAATLAYLANQAAVEFHIWLSTMDDIDRPDRLVIDLDPPPDIEVAVLRSIAHRFRDLFTEIGLTPFTQATGGRGYHVVAPLDRSEDFDFVRALALDLAERVAEAEPDLVTTAQRKQRREGRIFLDVGRNGYAQTFVAPYSLRARPGAAIATPLDWDELGRSRPNGVTITKMRRRLAQKTDPWARIDDHAASPTEARNRFDALG
ncbi:non-homologous end-joining DNA ligase [Glycomyces sp. NPDC046736]|uniref:non-homologous end-joining DNA ligase n=1 Tax=Glycomyces sp. NPDC046736 TaxID=3155615 RepID=UPI0033D0D522